MIRRARFRPEEDAALRRLWGRRSIARIAGALGRAPSSIWHRSRHLGLRPPRPARHCWTAVEKARLAELWCAGAPLRDIAGRLGLSVYQTDQQRRRLGLPNRKAARRGFSREDDAVILARWGKDGPTALSRLIGRTGAAVSRRALRKLGLPPLINRAPAEPGIAGPDLSRLMAGRA